MPSKGKFIHIRADDKLHQALTASADLDRRPSQDEARYLLELALKHKHTLVQMELDERGTGGRHTHEAAPPKQVRRPKSA